MPKPMNKEMGGKPKMSGDQMKVLGRVMKYMLKNYKFSFIIVVACILIQAVTTLAGMMFMQLRRTIMREEETGRTQSPL